MSTFGVFRSTSEMVYDASKRLKSALKSYKKTKRKKRETVRSDLFSYSVPFLLLRLFLFIRSYLLLR